MAARSESGERWERSPGYIYFIAAGSPPLAVKIGVSTQRDITRRLSTHQGSNHEPLTILRLIPVEGFERPMVEAERQERELHARFSSLCRFAPGWAGSEWFTATADLLDFVSSQGVDPEDRGVPRTIARPGPGRA